MRSSETGDFPISALDREGPGVPYTGSLLHRADRNRENADWLESCRCHPTTRYLPFWDLKVAMFRKPLPDLYWVGADQLPDHVTAESASVFLGLDRDDNACFAASIEEDVRILLEPSGAGFVDARSAAAQLDDGRAAIVAQARSLLNWNAQNPYCARCGAPTRPQKAGTQRKCASNTCEVVIFPRVDPVVIMLVVSDDGEQCLLGRNLGYPGNLVSALAGYMEPGESIEEAVRREILEEAGVLVGTVRYFTSQPWPFPATLMIGCFAVAKHMVLDVNYDELEWARWFAKSEVQAILTGANEELSAPRSIAIAHHLIKHWLAHGRQAVP